YDATGVLLRDSLPDGLTLDSVDGASCSADGDLYCQVRDLGGGESVTVRFLVHGKQAGSFTNSASASSQTWDSNGENNSASQTTQIVEPAPRAHLTVVAHV